MEEKGGLYIHFPFCKRKCPYCHFYSIAGERKMFRKWLEGIVEEMKLHSEIKLKFDTIFIGGGSPSLLYPEDIHKIFESAKKYFDLDVIEFSMEVNPDIRDREIIKGWREAGVGRMSIGIQSFDKNILEKIGREYTPTKAIDFFFLCREEGFENINVDLIIGFPGERKDNPKKIIENIKIMEPDHVSIYILENYEGLPFEELAKEIGIPDDDFISQEYYELKEGLQSLSFIHYEISNFAKEGKKCLHNLKYWNYNPFLGLGPSACSNLIGKRWCNVPDVEEWFKGVKEGEIKKEEIVELNKFDMAKEAIILGLRLVDGIKISEFKRRFDFDIVKEFSENINRLKEENLIILEEDRMAIREDKLLLSNEVLVNFL